MTIEAWSKKVAALALDELVNAVFLRREDFDAALEIAAEEIRIRLVMEDYPPIQDASSAPR